MNILSIGSKITLRKISEEIVDKVESINFLDTTTNNFLNWGLSKTKKINYYSGDITKIDTLINAGLNDSDIIIVHSSNPYSKSSLYNVIDSLSIPLIIIFLFILIT